MQPLALMSSSSMSSASVTLSAPTACTPIALSCAVVARTNSESEPTISADVRSKRSDGTEGGAKRADVLRRSWSAELAIGGRTLGLS